MRIKLLFLAFIILLLFLAGRLFQLQVLQREELAALANKIHTQTVAGEEFPRGNILDRHGKSLLDTRELPAVAVFPSMLENPEKAFNSLSINLQLPLKRIEDQVELSKNYYANAPFILRTNLTEYELQILQNDPIPGVYIVPVKSRYGPESLAVHLIGHLNSIDQATWERLQEEGRTGEGLNSYKKSDVIGVKGIEALYENYLKGSEPEHYLKATIDAKGQLLVGLGFDKLETQAGKTRNNIILTLDKNIQKAVEQVMDDKISRGAVVVMRVTTGEVLAMASRPEFDQNFVFKHLQNSKQHEFINRALEHYYPGSVFKTLIAAAALEEKVVEPEENFICTGEYTFETGLRIPCWKEEGHGALTLLEALAQSCNPTFIDLGLRLGREKIIEYGRRFGLDKNLLLGYSLSNFPSLGIEKNSPGAIGNASLGQQGIMLSPLQVASLMSTIANEGIYLQPRIVEKLEDETGKVYKTWSTPKGSQAISKVTAEHLVKMLTAVTTSGTGKNAWVVGSGSAGKTSTAQTGSQSPLGTEIVNAWFAGFAPLEKPEYAIAVMVEDGSTGGGDAAPIFREILEKILEIEY